VRVYAYVDGFNLYYGALKGTLFRWLNPVDLVKLCIPADHNLIRLKYFTARVSGATDPGGPVRQHAYLSAITTLPEVEVHYGRFLSKNIWRPVTNFPAAEARIHSPDAVTLPRGTHLVTGGSLTNPANLVVDVYPPKGAKRAKRATTPVTNAFMTEVHSMEEKGSDVNLASHLLNDAWKDLFDQAVVISNDTDLVEPIRMVSVERRKPVVVVCPGRWQMALDLQRVANFKVHIRLSMLRAAQLPDPIPGTTIRKPATW